MTAPHHPHGEPLVEFTPAVTDLLNCRVEQVHRYGHSPAQDDRKGPRALVKRAEAELIHACDLMGYGHEPLQPDQAKRARRLILNAAAILIASADVIDRAGNPSPTSQTGDYHG